jgi:hypothetical protein
MSLLNALTMKITNGRAILIAEGNDEHQSQRWWNSKYYSNGLLLVHGKVIGITKGKAKCLAIGISNGIANSLANGIANGSQWNTNGIANGAVKPYLTA